MINKKQTALNMLLSKIKFGIKFEDIRDIKLDVTCERCMIH